MKLRIVKECNVSPEDRVIDLLVGTRVKIEPTRVLIEQPDREPEEWPLDGDDTVVVDVIA